MSLRKRMGRTCQGNGAVSHFETWGVAGSPFPAAGQPPGHHMEDRVDDEIEERVRDFESPDRPSQVVVIEGTQGVGKTNLLRYYEQQFRELYEEDEGLYIIRYSPDPEPSFDSVVRRIFQGLDHAHFERIGETLAEASPEARDDVKEVARNHEVRMILNSLERAAAEPEKLSECARLAMEWFGGLRIFNRHREGLGVYYRLDTVESRTQALKDVVYVSERLGLLRGILLLLDELEKQDYSLSKTPVLRFLSAIRALIDALPRNLFLFLAMTPQAKMRYFAMMPALAGRLQDILELKPMAEFGQARALYSFYVKRARKNARASEGMQGKVQGNEPIFDDDHLQRLFDEVSEKSRERGTEGVTPRDFLHRLHNEWRKHDRY